VPAVGSFLCSGPVTLHPQLFLSLPIPQISAAPGKKTQLEMLLSPTHTELTGDKYPLPQLRF
ncbi:hypothetical protein U1Q18_031114, partial [Sarracenia purpurea var. burkii]